MTELRVRRPKFDFTDDVPFIWNPQNPAFSLFMNATSMIAICFEQMIVTAVQEAKPLMTEPAIAAEATAFLRQEAQHSSSHRKHVTALTRAYPGLQQTLDDAIADYDELGRSTPLKFRLAYVADLEATFTPSFKMFLDNEATLFAPGDDRVASLLLWHFVEEVEHRSSALVIYDAVVGEKWYRIRALPRVVRHLLRIMAVIADGINTHVPWDDRRVDARTLLPAYGFRHTLSRKLAAAPPGEAGPAFAAVPRPQLLHTAAGVLLSQTPYHNPEHQQLPAFADQWFDRWDRGGDVAHWYTASAH
ncbi:MAG: metal-dependent hydrolase [Mycobacterium sp.]